MIMMKQMKGQLFSVVVVVSDDDNDDYDDDDYEANVEDVYYCIEFDDDGDGDGDNI